MRPERSCAELLLHGDGPVERIDVGRLQRQHLAEAQTAEAGQEHHCAVAGVDRVGEVEYDARSHGGTFGSGLSSGAFDLARVTADTVILLGGGHDGVEQPVSLSRLRGRYS